MYNIISVIAIIASFIPIVLVLVKKLWKESAFLLIAFYWVLSGMVNILDKTSISRDSMDLVTIIYNMVDIPIVLGLIYFTTKSFRLKRFTRIAAPGLLVAQLISFMVKGWNYDAAKYVLAAGLLMVIYVVLWELSLYMHKLEHTRHEKAMVFIHVSFLFAYGTFIIIYIFDYYIKVGTSIDNFIIYYISSLVATIIASIGYLAKGSSRNFI